VSIATLLGLYDGFFGPGTGTLLVLAFSYWTHASLREATADAKVVNLASNLAALALFLSGGLVNLALALPMAAAQIAGARVGALLALRVGDRLVRAVVLIVAAALFAKLMLEIMP
jgi:uncharacterized membrane protein YfcA